MKLEIHEKPEAKIDLLQHFIYIGEENLDTAERFLSAVEDALAKLSEMPGMGPTRAFTKPELRDVRSWPVKGFQNYLIFYRATEKRLEVMRVVHGARDVDRIFEGSP